MAQVESVAHEAKEAELAEAEAAREIAAARFLAEMAKHPKSGEVVETEDQVFFWKPPSAFDQWSPCRFEVDGFVYNCAEQFMMAEKAKLFDDGECRSRILAELHPLKQKHLGQKVRGFCDMVWERERLSIVIAGNRAKFMQNTELRTRLLATGQRQLVEASPQDGIWGIGLGVAEAQSIDPGQWPGQNLLGKALMVVREELQELVAEEHTSDA